jgi:hypothetical protein
MRRPFGWRVAITFVSVTVVPGSGASCHRVRMAAAVIIISVRAKESPMHFLFPARDASVIGLPLRLAVVDIPMATHPGDGVVLDGVQAMQRACHRVIRGDGLRLMLQREAARRPSVALAT